MKIDFLMFFKAIYNLILTLFQLISFELKDNRFNKDIDFKTGYHTKAIVSILFIFCNISSLNLASGKNQSNVHTWSFINSLNS